MRNHYYDTIIGALNRDLKLLDFDLLRTGPVLVVRFNNSGLGHYDEKGPKPCAYTLTNYILVFTEILGG